MMFEARQQQKWAEASKKSGHGSGSSCAFSLLEILVATAVLLILLVLVFSITQQISKVWTGSTAKIESFQAGRMAFDSITRQISLATLNTYYDYFDKSGLARSEIFKASGTAGLTGFDPDHYGRYSDLHFISGKSLLTGAITQVGHAVFFQAPLGYSDTPQEYGGMNTLFNACGYFVAYGKDNTRPSFLDDGTIPNRPADRYRFRLFQFIQPSQNLGVYATGTTDWFTNPLKESVPPIHVLAENVIALVILPRSSRDDQGSGAPLTSDFEYNSRPSSVSGTQGPTDYQLPPVLEVAMVTIDESSAQRLCKPDAAPDFGIPGGLASLFRNLDTTNPRDPIARDLKTLTDALTSLHINYRVFRTEIALRGAKWTSPQ